MTPQDAITRARVVVNDTDAAVMRQQDTELLPCVNDAIKEISVLRRDLFTTTGDYTCIPGQTEQALSFNEVQEFVRVLRIKDGAAVHDTEMQTLARFNPSWSSDPAGPAENWMNSLATPLRFYVYPKAPSLQVLEVEYVRNPGVYGLNDQIQEIPEVLLPALAWYVVFRAEMKDDEHVNSGRAVAAYTLFKSLVTGKEPAPPAQ